MSKDKPSTGQAGSVPVDVRIELGRRKLPIDFFMNCAEGSLIELPESTIKDGPLVADLRANGALVARGEVVVIAENFGLRVTEVVKD